MPAAKIDGNAVAAAVRAEIKKEVEAIIKLQAPDAIPPPAAAAPAAAAAEGAAKPAGDAPLPEIPAGVLRPGLAVVIVGTRGDSQTYVRLKEKAATECLFKSVKIELPEESKTEDIVAQVQRLNADPTITGILVQLPLPKHVDEPTVLDAIDAHKDVDGLHPLNVGALYLKGRRPHAVPCTPQACIALLKRSGVQIEGKHAVVLGRSNIVGLPVAQLLLQENATVTICHSKTENLPEVVRQADILIAAVGRAAMVQGSWLKPGAVVIDVGTNPVKDATKATGVRLVGDCDASCWDVASQMTPVPGGVGPNTIAFLLLNTLNCFKNGAEFAKLRAAAAAPAAAAKQE